jgi:hypothetical protein
MKPTGLPGAKKRSAADERAKARKIKLDTSDGSCSWVRAASRAVSSVNVWSKPLLAVKYESQVYIVI